MSEFQDHGLSGGVWSGTLRRARVPARVVMTHLGRIVAKADLADAGEGEWDLRVGLPVDHLSDGIQTFLLLADDAEAGEDLQPGAERLASLSVLAGAPLDSDIRAELELLRAELDLLKREFRRLATLG